jgi:hypothetical protein
LQSFHDDKQVLLRDRGDRFEVTVPGPLAVPEGWRPDPGFPYLRAKHGDKLPTGVRDVVDYDHEKEHWERFKKAQQQARKARQTKSKRADEQANAESLEADKPRSDWRLLQVLNTLQGDGPSNLAHEAIAGGNPERLRSIIAEGLANLQRGNESGIDWDGTLVQIFVPLAAKGYGRLKPSGTARNDKTKEAWRDPLVEWLRVRGYFRSAVPFFTGDDIRILTPIPGDLSARALERAAAEMRSMEVYGSGAKVECLSVTSLARLLIERSQEFHRDRDFFPGLSLRGRTPASVLSGVAIGHFQKLGSARIVRSLSTLALPGWYPISSREDADAWLSELEVHSQVLQRLRDDHSDEVGLILLYRRTLERRGVESFLAFAEFLERYGPIWMSSRNDRSDRRGLPRFNEEHFRRTAMATDKTLGAILEDEGFRAIALAIRKATVSAQAMKSMGRKDYREIRYDLLPELRRKRTLNKPAFIETLSSFISSYNSENARRRELGKPAPANVTTEQLASLVGLVDEYGASLIGALLCAYGTCKEPRETDEPTAAAS